MNGLIQVKFPTQSFILVKYFLPDPREVMSMFFASGFLLKIHRLLLQFMPCFPHEFHHRVTGGLQISPNGSKNC